MKHSFNTERFVSCLRSKRGNRTLRDIALEMDGTVSISTLSRIERGSVPDMATLFALCDWLGIAAPNFISTDFDAGLPNQAITAVDRIRLILLSSKRFAPDVATALITLVDKLYEPSDM